MWNEWVSTSFPCSWNHVTCRAGLDVLLCQVLLKVHYRLYFQQTWASNKNKTLQKHRKEGLR